MQLQEGSVRYVLSERTTINSRKKRVELTDDDDHHLFSLEPHDVTVMRITALEAGVAWTIR